MTREQATYGWAEVVKLVFYAEQQILPLSRKRFDDWEQKTEQEQTEILQEHFNDIAEVIVSRMSDEELAEMEEV